MLLPRPLEDLWWVPVDTGHGTMPWRNLVDRDHVEMPVEDVRAAGVLVVICLVLVMCKKVDEIPQFKTLRIYLGMRV